MEDAIRLRGVRVPDQLLIVMRSCWRHHAIDPLGVKERLVDVGRAVVPLTLHVEVVTPIASQPCSFKPVFLDMYPCSGIVPPAPTSL